MDKPIRVLIVEDSQKDVALEVRALEASGYQVTFTVVDTAAEMKAALVKQAFDIVISDHDLPQFNAPGALAVLQERDLDIPFIIVSGAIGEEIAVELMKAGAHDYVSKNNLSKLAPAIDHALKDAENRSRIERVEALLKQSEERYRMLVEQAYEGIIVVQDGKIVFSNPRAYEIIDYPRDRTEPRPFIDFIHEEDREKVVDNHVRRLKGEQFEVTYPVRLVDLHGNIKWVLMSAVRIDWEHKAATLTFLTEITAQKLVELALSESESKFSHVFYDSPFPLSLTRVSDGILIEVNNAWEETYGFTSSEACGKTTEELGISTNPEERAHIYAMLREKGNLHNIEITGYRTKDGAKPIMLVNFDLLEFGGQKYVLTSAQDITERRKAEQALKDSEERYRLLAEHMTDTVWLMDMNLKTTYQSPSVLKVRGFSPREIEEMPLEKHLTPESFRAAFEIFTEDIPRVEADPGYNPIHTLDLEYLCKDGTTLWAETKFSVIRDKNGKPISILAEARDITERKLIEEELLKSYESVKKTLNDAIRTIAKIVEVRDPYTAGHQQKVADLAIAIAGEMDLGDARIDNLRMAAVIHDIGKMYIPSDILSRPGKLTDMEFALIKTHAQGGYDVIKGMDFPGTVSEAVLQHHERLDGSGYPNQIKGVDMILEAKILAVADVVEAMASHRPYRPALGTAKALEEISKNRGRLYDSDVVDICLKLFTEKGFKFKE
jgi:PAS domain S-box-containing protein/putative nucleotidyltransferase with HDIG domain